MRRALQTLAVLLVLPWLAGVGLLSGCTRDPSPAITRPDNRIQYFLAQGIYLLSGEFRERFRKEMGRHPSGEEGWEISAKTFHEFMTRELGRGFTEGDFVAYMEANEAECARDPQNGIMYCRYIDFKEVPEPVDLLKTYSAVSYYCFWALPPADKPLLRALQAGAGSVKEFPASRAEFSRTRDIAGCRALLLKFHGVEK